MKSKFYLFFVFLIILLFQSTNLVKASSISLKVNFDSTGGSSVASQTVSYGNRATRPSDPIRSGYLLEGWYAKWGQSVQYYSDYVTLDLTPTGFTSTIKSNVFYDSNRIVYFINGSYVSETYKGKMYYFNKLGPETAKRVVTISQSDVIEVYLCDGIPGTSTNKSSGKLLATGRLEGAKRWNFDVDKITSDITLYAEWSKNNFTVNFNSDGGSIVPSQQVKSGSTVSKPVDPIKTGYVLGGWYAKGGQAIQYYSDYVTLELSPTGFTSTIKPSVFYDSKRIAYFINGKYLSETYEGTMYYFNKLAPETAKRFVPILPGDVIEVYLCDGIPGYSYNTSTAKLLARGMLESNTVDRLWNFDADVVTGDLTLYAKWNVGSKYTVIFNSSGGSAVSNQQVNSGTSAIKPTDPVKSGYTFGGWYIDCTFTTPWDFSDKVISDLTLYAKWINNNPTTYTISFDADGGTPSPKDQKVLEGREVEEPTMPEKMGYDFDGWYTSKNYSTKWEFGRAVVSDMILYARWKVSTREEFIVKFDSTGGDKTPKTQIINKGQFASSPAKPNKSGYEFVGWFKDPVGSYKWTFKTDKVYSDMTLYAVWTKSADKYTVTFVAEGGSKVKPINDVISGSIIAMPTPPSKPGDCFSGWFTDNKTFNNRWIFTRDKVYSDITLYAKWCYNN